MRQLCRSWFTAVTSFERRLPQKEVEHHAEGRSHPCRHRRGTLADGQEERAADIGTVGTNVTDHVAADGSNNIAVTADISDMDAARALMASPSPEMAARMESHGVIQPITLYVEA